MSLHQQKLLDILAAPSSINDEELESLQQAVRKYPYFQLGYSLIAKAKHDRQSPDANDALHLAAIYAPSRLRLKQLFYNEIKSSDTDTTAPTTEASPAGTSTPEEPEQSASQEAGSITETPEGTGTSTSGETPTAPDQSQREDVYRELEENLQHLRSSKQQKNAEDTETPADSGHDQQKSQMELIDKFINSERDVRIRWRYHEDDSQDLSEKNILSSSSLVTENLAEIYVKQEKKDKAIEIYQKLILKYPDKKTYFAEKIESLKEN